MNRSDVQRLAELRVTDGRVLLSAGNFAGAYYLAGYSVESALKACIAKRVRKHDFPDLKTVRDSHQHDLEKLLAVTDLKPKLEKQTKRNREFEANWAVVKDWSEQKRYETDISEKSARDLLTAITDPKHGVLPWLQMFW